MPQFVHEMFQEVASTAGAATAIAGSDRSLTYAELDNWSTAIANRLIDNGAKNGSIVYIAVDSTFSVIGCMLAALKAGGVFVPVDPSQPAARLLSLAERVPPEFILTESRVAQSLAISVALSVPAIVVDEDELTTGSHTLNTNGIRRSEPEDMCYVYFTSGSTGKPKAIAGRLKSIDHFIRWEIEAFNVKPGTVFSQLTSPVFDAFLRDVFTPLCAGGIVRIPDSREVVLDPHRLARWINESNIEIIHTVPSLFRAVLNETLSPEQFPGLRYVALAGEPLLPSDVQRWISIFGQRIQIVNLYGSTETTMVKLFHVVKPEDASRRTIPVGKAMPGAKALVLDEAGNPAAEGAIGEIIIRTPYRTIGYYGDPELTAQVFVPNPLSDDPSDIVYRTGDLGRLLEDGSIEFLGRKDQQVKIRGIRIELEEIEDAILKTGLVKETAVTSRVDRAGNSYLCAYTVGSGGSFTEQLRDALAAVLPEYMLPSIILELQRIPRTPTGKIDRKSLPQPEEVRLRGEAIEPRNEIEAEVAKLFASVLGLERVGVDEDFFRIGGHSLLAMSLLSSLSEHFEIDLPLAILFEHPTVEEMAIEIAARQQQGSVPWSDRGLFETDALASRVESRIAEMTDAEVDSLLSEILEAQ